MYLNLNGTKTSPEQSGPKASDAKYSNFAKPANGHRQDEVFQVEKEDQSIEIMSVHTKPNDCISVAPVINPGWI